jgi:catechol 2,3-dioxygenase-like lactoylglutathione lyase family enzyme
MLGDKDVIATIAVNDVSAARAFYEGKLGLQPEPSVEPSVLQYRSGRSQLLVYESQFAGTNEATAATWIVGNDIETVVGTLKAAGIAFEHYDMPGMERHGDIHGTGQTRSAWFKDPDGNILAIVSG